MVSICVIYSTFQNSSLLFRCVYLLYLSLQDICGLFPPFHTPSIINAPRLCLLWKRVLINEDKGKACRAGRLLYREYWYVAALQAYSMNSGKSNTSVIPLSIAVLCGRR